MYTTFFSGGFIYCHIFFLCSCWLYIINVHKVLVFRTYFTMLKLQKRNVLEPLNYSSWRLLIKIPVAHLLGRNVLHDNNSHHPTPPLSPNLHSPPHESLIPQTPSTFLLLNLLSTTKERNRAGQRRQKICINLVHLRSPSRSQNMAVATTEYWMCTLFHPVVCLVFIAGLNGRAF